ncbi:hypothetical protein KL86PLE_70061 [uncultured Pleomorphomonas sp.]|uniref:Uncharacterized protein n=1 Tax=uncultured Pleomorphomonas sp. TaxID=442121 RepID=A0A212LL80_9HYPH|nr:hypothetical protein KL86PLE_70061 [uncultured Pleomorphomonas sp.]
MRKFPRRGYPSADLFQCNLECVEFRFERRVDHARAELDDEAADQRRVDVEFNMNRLAGYVGQRALDVGELAIGKGNCRNDAGGHLAAPVSEQLTEAAEHVGQIRKAVVGGDQLDEIAHRAAEAGGLDDGADGLELVLGGEDQRFHQAAKVGAFAAKGLETGDVRLDDFELAGLVRQLEQGRGIPFGDPEDHRFRFAHVTTPHRCEPSKVHPFERFEDIRKIAHDSGTAHGPAANLAPSTTGVSLTQRVHWIQEFGFCADILRYLAAWDISLRNAYPKVEWFIVLGDIRPIPRK